MLTFLLGGCGTGKSTILMERIRADLQSGETVLIVVPEQFSFEAEKRLYDFLGAALFNRLQTFSFATLSRHILREYADAAAHENYADEQEKLLLLRHAIHTVRQRGELSILSRRSDTADFTQAMLSMITKLRKAGVTAQRLLDSVPAFPDRLGEKTTDIAMILLEYDRLLEAHGLHDGLVDLTEAALLANMQDYFAGKRLYLDEFDSFTGDQYSMLEVMLAQAAHTAIAIRTDEPHVVISPIFEGGNHTYRRLLQMAREQFRIPVEELFCETYRRSAYRDLSAVSTQILRRKIHPADYEGHVYITEAPDPAAEAEYIGATICRLLSEDPELRCRDIAVAVKSLEDYGSLLERAFERYGLPYHISDAMPVQHTELMRYVLSLLALLADEAQSTDIILRYLKIPFAGYDAVAVSMLEHFCFTWSIEKEDWSHPFYDEEDPGLMQRAEPFGGETLERTRCLVLEEIADLRRQCAGKDIRTVLTKLWAHLCRKKDARSEALESLGVLEKRSFATLWNMLADMLDTLVSCFGQEIADFSELHSMLLLMIRSSSFSTPPQTLDSIQIVEAQTARLHAPKLVFVPGVSENTFPGEIHLGGIFSRQELELLEENGISVSRMFFELYSDERLIVSKILSAPKEGLYLTCPRMNAAGERTAPSVVIGQIRQMFPETPQLSGNTDELPLTYYVRTEAAAYYHFVRSIGTRDDGELTALRELLEREPLYAARIAKLLETHTAATETIRPEIMQRLLGERIILSPSGIESFYSCPFQYFFEKCLRLYIPEQNSFSSRNVGNFAHYCFEQIFRKFGKEGFVKLTQAELAAEIHQFAEEFSVQNFSDALRRDGRFRLNYRMSGRGLLQVLLHMQREMRGGQFTPVGFEVLVSDRENAVIPPLLLQDGRISCGGKIDRIDLCNTPEGTMLRVVDYKTGLKEFSPEKLAYGLDMQMLIYLFALRQSSPYGDAAPGGVLYMPSGQLRTANYHDREKAKKNADEILDEFYQMKGLVLDSAASRMEPEIALACKPILDTSAGSDLYMVTRDQMERLENHVYQKICDMADTLRAGEIAPKPTPAAPCDYCRCKGFCNSRICAVQLDKAAKQEAVESIFREEGKEEEA